jgi:transcriptional regulator with GAF, ATPase, and Fis domain
MTTEMIPSFMTLSVDRIDTEIRIGIRKIVEVLDLDRGFLSQYSDQRKHMVRTHCHDTSDGKKDSNSRTISVFPWFVERILRGERVIFPRVADLPEAADKAGKYFRSVDTQSHLSIPLEIDGIVIGCLSLESTRAEIAWTEEIFRVLKPIAAVFALSLERKRRKLEVLERIRFETLISDISARFMAAEPDDVDREIMSALESIGGYFACDRCVILSVRPDLGEVRVMQAWFSEGANAPETSAVNLAPMFPWAYEMLVTRGQAIWASRLEDLPPEADKDRRSWVAQGVTSFLNIPLFSGAVVRNMFVMQNMHEEKLWEGYIQRLRLIGEIFSNALEQKKSFLENREKQREITERARFENLLADISARFVNLEPDDLDSRIEQSLEMIGKFFLGDRCGLLEAHTDKLYATVTHAWYDDGFDPIPGDLNIAPLFPWGYEELVKQGRIIKVSNTRDLPPEAMTDFKTHQAMGVQSFINIPLHTANDRCSIFVINNILSERPWPVEYVPRLRLIGEVFINALARTQADKKLLRAYEEVRELKDKLQVEAEFLRSEIRFCQNREEIIGQSEALSNVMTQVEQVAPTDTTVLICGETGTGKELIAHAIHDMSLYRDKLMVKVNCASLPATLVESELFGREKGAYTGAMTRQIGRFEIADGSTIFLDEIAELPLELQAKLLRVLQDNTFERLGSPKTIKVNVRVIAATNRIILDEVKKGKFREDLYYRLNVFPITVPPLRERCEDIPMLVWAFVNEFCEKMGKQLYKITKHDMEGLQRYSWPGNIRELRNIIEHAVIVSNNGTLKVKLPQDAGKQDAGKQIDWAKTLEEVESRHIMDVLRHTDGRIKGEGGAASILGMIPSTLNSRMKKLGIRLRNEKGEISS